LTETLLKIVISRIVRVNNEKNQENKGEGLIILRDRSYFFTYEHEGHTKTFLSPLDPLTHTLRYKGPPH
jgi:hypothetical protein